MKKNNIFFTSDHHFGHDNIISKFKARPFESLEEMHRTLIENWNKIVMPEDTVIILGDFSYRISSSSYARIMDQLNGHKILVKGNHDHIIGGFDLVVNQMEMEIDKKRVTLSHYPLAKDCNTYDKRFIPLMIKDEGQYHIHGHTHSKVKMNERSINVCIDAWDFYPVPMHEIKRLIQKDAHLRKKEIQN